MRYYNIVITDPVTGKVLRQYSSLDSQGRFIPGALNVEFDIPVIAFGNPGSGAFVRVWGIALTDITQSSDLNYNLIQVYAGMSKGLPLANQDQQGLLVEGYIYQAYGNWLGTTQTLDMQIFPGKGPNFDSRNFTFRYPKNTKLADGIRNTLQTAYPEYTVDVSEISPDLVLPYDQPGQYSSISQFASFLNDLSLALNPATATGVAYSGINILVQNNSVIRVIDNSGTVKAPKEILFTDLIGQPVWQSPVSFQFNSIMRGDLQIGMFVKMPVAQFTTVPTSLAQFRTASAFQGVAQILGGDAAIRHVGNYRQPDGTAWVTTVNCVVLP